MYNDDIVHPRAAHLTALILREERNIMRRLKKSILALTVCLAMSAMLCACGTREPAADAATEPAADTAAERKTLLIRQGLLLIQP